VTLDLTACVLLKPLLLSLPYGTFLLLWVFSACSRSDGLAQQVLSCLAKVKAGKDEVLAGCAALTLLALSCEDAHPAYLASTAAALLMDQLLQVTGHKGRQTTSTISLYGHAQGHPLKGQHRPCEPIETCF
jgi:hypothetical protein